MAGQIIKGEGFDDHGRFVLATYRVSPAMDAIEGVKAHRFAVAYLHVKMERRGVMPDCYFLEGSKTDDSTVYRAIAGTPQ